MRFYTPSECEEWLTGRQRQKPDCGPASHVHRLIYPTQPHRFYFIADWIAHSLPQRMPTLLWMTEWGIWSSTENWHLYYKLRQSYVDARLLHEAPGHLFLEYEAEDLVSFLQLSMLNGWGGYVLTHANYANAFFSHDEFIDFYADNDGNLAGVREALTNTSRPCGDRSSNTVREKQRLIS
jgi:hypothetical protein